MTRSPQTQLSLKNSKIEFQTTFCYTQTPVPTLCPHKGLQPTSTGRSGHGWTGRGCRNTLLSEEAGHKWPQDTYLDTVSTIGHSTEAESGSCQGRAGAEGRGPLTGTGFA